MYKHAAENSAASNSSGDTFVWDVGEVVKKFGPDWHNSQLAMAVKRRERQSIPSIPTQSFHMGPKYNVQTCCRKFSGIQQFWGHVCVGEVGKFGPDWHNSQLAMA